MNLIAFCEEIVRLNSYKKFYHNVHHSSTDYNLTVASRLSWLEVSILWIFYIPMALLGLEPLQILIAVQIRDLRFIKIPAFKLIHLTS